MTTLQRLKHDWPQFKREGLIAAIVLVMAVALLSITRHYLDQAVLIQAQSQDLLGAATAALSNIEHERADLIASQPRYRRLVDLHILGKEDRMAWRDSLENAANQYHLNKLSYTLAARSPLAHTLPGATGEPDVTGGGVFKRYYARMLVLARFENEHGFIDMLDDLAEGAHAILVMRACHIKRLNSQETGGQSLLEAECQLDWVTFERNVNAEPVSQGDQM